MTKLEVITNIKRKHSKDRRNNNYLLINIITLIFFFFILIFFMFIFFIFFFFCLFHNSISFSFSLLSNLIRMFVVSLDIYSSSILGIVIAFAVEPASA